jgi:hypothetical protein
MGYTAGFKWTKEKVDELRELTKQGHTTSEAAKKMGLAYHQISGTKQRYGINSNVLWTEEKIGELKNWIEQKKYTCGHAAVKMNLRYFQVLKACRRYKIKVPHKGGSGRTVWTKEKVYQLENLVEKGCRANEIANKMNTGILAIHSAMHHYGIKSKVHGPLIKVWTKERLAKLKELKISGRTNVEIAEILSLEFNQKISSDSVHAAACRSKLTKYFLSKDTEMKTYQVLTLPIDNYLITCDYHSPYHSELWINRGLAMADKFKIKKHIIIGDLFDFNALKYFTVDDGGPKRDLDEEIAQTDPVIRALDYFDENILLCGNHERRVGMKTDSIIQARHLFGLYGEGVWNRKFKYSVYDKLFIGNDWMVVHPRSYSQISTSVARRMAEKYHRNILNAHGHFVGMAYDRSGKFLAIDLGGMFDTKKIDYINLQTTTHPNWKNGFGILYNEKFYFFTDETDWNFWLNK